MATGFKTIKGLNTSIPTGIEINAKTVEILRKYEKNGVVAFISSPKDELDSETLTHLRAISSQESIALLTAGNDRYYLFDPSSIAEVI